MGTRRINHIALRMAKLFGVLAVLSAIGLNEYLTNNIIRLTMFEQFSPEDCIQIKFLSFLNG